MINFDHPKERRQHIERGSYVVEAGLVDCGVAKELQVRCNLVASMHVVIGSLGY